MADIQYGVKFSTTYKVGDDATVRFSWIRYNFDDYKTTDINLYVVNNGQLDVANVSVGTFLETKQHRDLIYITNMDVIGNGYLYEDISNFKIISSTDPAEVEYINENDTNYYPSCGMNNYRDAYIVYFIPSINFSKNLKNIPSGLFSFLKSFDTEIESGLSNIVGAGLLNIEADIERIGKQFDLGVAEPDGTDSFANYTYIGNFAWGTTTVPTAAIQNPHAWVYNGIYQVNLNCDSLEYVGAGTFTGAVNIIGSLDNVKEIASCGFYKNNNITELSLSDNVIMHDRAFYECKNLTKINDGNVLNSKVQGNIFYRCNNIEQITLGENFEFEFYYNDYFYGEIDNSLLVIKPYEGSNLYDGEYTNYMGWQVLNVIDNRVIDTTDFNWGTGYIYVSEEPVIENKELLNIICGYKIIRLKAYEDGEIAIAVGNEIKKLRVVDVDNSKASPVRVVWGNEIKAISY